MKPTGVDVARDGIGVVVPLIVLLSNTARQLAACMVMVPTRAIVSVRTLATLTQVVIRALWRPLLGGS